MNDADVALSPAILARVLAEADPFESYSATKANVPVLAAFGVGRLHGCQAEGDWDLEAAMAAAPDELFRSVRFLNVEKERQRWDCLTFRRGPRAFVTVRDTRLVGFAETAGEAKRLAADFARRFGKASPTRVGGYQLIRTYRGEIFTDEVPLGGKTMLDATLFAMHYGAEGVAWHHGFIGQLHCRNHGLAILEGPPGTGKTSYLRHLMGELKDTHHFYFLPPASLEALSDPGFVGFWGGQHRQHSDLQLVVVLEDADAALMPRSGDNRNQVSAILNLSDGLLADFLRLQIICTINGRAADIDPALLRPGRLLCHRVFPRLEAAEARRLAEHLGRSLPLGGEEDYSLAEVYAGEGGSNTVYAGRPRLGFVA